MTNDDNMFQSLLLTTHIPPLPVPTVPGNQLNASSIISELSKVVAKASGKPESYVLISLTTDKPMCFAGTEDPCAWADIVSVGGFNGRTREMSAAIMPAIESALGVSQARCYLKFTSVDGSDLGWKGSTF